MELSETTVEKLNNLKYVLSPGECLYKNVLWSPSCTLDVIQKLEYDFIFYPNDILVATYAKSGTTVLQEIVWLMLNDVDISQAKKAPISERCPYLENDLRNNFEVSSYNNNDTKINLQQRFFKTHLLYRNLENQMKRNPEMKILVTIRNPKDNAVSMFHFYKGIKEFGPFEGSWDDFFERWIDGWISGGDWLDVTTEWWNKRFEKNIKIILFEDIIYKKREVILDLCEFLNKKLTELQIDQIISHTDFKEMRVNPVANFTLMESFQPTFTKEFQFMRKGEVGDWKNYFTEEQSRRLDEKYNSILEKCGLKLRYE